MISDMIHQPRVDQFPHFAQTASNVNLSREWANRGTCLHVKSNGLWCYVHWFLGLLLSGSCPWLSLASNPQAISPQSLSHAHNTVGMVLLIDCCVLVPFFFCVCLSLSLLLDCIIPSITFFYQELNGILLCKALNLIASLWNAGCVFFFNSVILCALMFLFVLLSLFFFNSFKFIFCLRVISCL